MIVYPARYIRPFVTYCVNGKPRSSLLIESTDSMICAYRNITNVAQRNSISLKNSRSRELGDIINYYYRQDLRTSKVRRLLASASPEPSTCEVPRDVSRKLQLTVCDNGVVEVRKLTALSDSETSI